MPSGLVINFHFYSRSSAVLFRAYIQMYRWTTFTSIVDHLKKLICVKLRYIFMIFQFYSRSSGDNASHPVSDSCPFNSIVDHLKAGSRGASPPAKGSTFNSIVDHLHSPVPRAVALNIEIFQFYSRSSRP